MVSRSVLQGGEVLDGRHVARLVVLGRDQAALVLVLPPTSIDDRYVDI